jgi:predicted enzyme related to lactoylglutathione lyase
MRYRCVLCGFQLLGGKIIILKQTVLGRGHFAVAIDPERNTFGLWEAILP